MPVQNFCTSIWNLMMCNNVLCHSRGITKMGDYV